jgi:hypothetical protein
VSDVREVISQPDVGVILDHLEGALCFLTTRLHDKVGGGYIPLDLEYPAERIRTIVSLAEVTLVLVTRGTTSTFSQLFLGLASPVCWWISTSYFLLRSQMSGRLLLYHYGARSYQHWFGFEFSCTNIGSMLRGAMLVEVCEDILLTQ